MMWKTLKTQWRDSANLLLGIWLIVSPWVLGFTDVTYAVWNAYALGVIIVVAALAALFAFHEWEEWVSMAFGAWLVVSPWVLAFAGTLTAMWNHVIVGLLVAGMAMWSIWDVRHGGMRTA